MDQIWLLSIAVAVIGILVLVFSLDKRRRLPPSPWLPLPIIGHLHLLKFPIHRTYQRISSELRSPIFSLRLGNRRLVVVSSPALVEECFQKNDVVLASRPRLLIAKYIGYNWTSLVAAPYGDHWRNLRRLTNTDVFSPSRLAVFRWMREEETRFLLAKISTTVCGGDGDFGRIALRPLLSQLTFNNIMRMVAGKRYFGNEGDKADEEATKFINLIKETFSFGGVGNPADFIPLLQWIDYKGFAKNLKRLSEEWDIFLQFLVDEKRKNPKSDGKGDTMIDHLLSLQQSDSEYYTDTIIKGIILVMLIAGTDTSSVTIEWAMTALLNNPSKMELAKREIDTVVGIDRLINESDISKLPYLNNVILETFRLYPAAPLLVPHEARSDCEIGGYHIPQGTMVIANAWAIHTDPTIWENATEFKPERFETAGEIGVGKLMPFGIGRRSCPGNGLANRVVSLVIGSLIQCFEWRRIGEELVDTMEGKSGTSMPKAVPLEAMCRPRFPLDIFTT